MARYRFSHRWHVERPPGELFELLADLASYPRWWHQVRRVVATGDDTADLHIRSFLPYTLRLHASRTIEDPTRGILQITLAGDLEGWARWTLLPAGDGCAVRYDQVVELTATPVRQLSFLARPVLRLNHSAMMRSARRGLLRATTHD